MSVRTLRLQNPASFELEEIRDLFLRAFESEPAPPAEAVLKELAADLPSDQLGVWVARNEAGEYVGLSVSHYWQSVWNAAPMVLYIWAPRNPEAKHALVDAMRGWYRGLGVEHVWAINRSHLDDEEYLAAFDAPGRIVASVIEFDVDGEVEDG